MSHTLAENSSRDLRFVVLTVVDYAIGGETVAATELYSGLSVAGIVFGTVPATKNSLGVPLFPLLNTGKVMLFRFVAGVPTEIPATTALNAIVPAIVLVDSIV